MPTGLTTVQVEINTATETEIVTSVSGERICVTAYELTSAAANQVDFRQSEDSTVVAGQFSLLAAGDNRIQAASPRDTPLIVFPVNRSLAIGTTAAVTLGGYVSYYITGSF